ncbi:MAG TPA: glycosyltransferase family 39 protein [Bacteroidia bacterium]
MLKKREGLLLFLLGIGLFFLFEYQKTFLYKVQGIHEWRQADCLAQVYNYYTNGFKFFDTSFLCINTSNCSGKVAGEFPILYYVTAILWKVFGQHEIILKLINFSLFLMGLVYLYKLGKKLFPDSWLKSLPVLFIIGSPVIVYYSNNYLPDIPALGLVFTGFYFFYDYLLEPQKKKLWKAGLFWVFAILLKITAGILPLASIAVLLFMAIREKQLGLRLKHLLPFAGGLVLAGAWYVYAFRYNEANQSHHFLLTRLMPIWELKGEALSLKTEAIFRDTIPELFPKVLNIIFLAVYLFLLFNFKRLLRPLVLISIITFIGTVIYFLFWYIQFEAHDYYFLNFIPFYACVFLLICNYYATVRHKALKIGITTLSLLLVMYNLYNGAVNIRLRYYHNDFLLQTASIHEDRRNLFLYLEKMHRFYITPFETCKPYLKQIGIKPEDRAIILPDYTFNMTLYYTGLRGYTACGRVGVDGWYYVHDENVMQSQIKCGAKYLLVYDERILEHKELLKYTTKPIGRYQNIIIYQLHE